MAAAGTTSSKARSPPTPLPGAGSLPRDDKIQLPTCWKQRRERERSAETTAKETAAPPRNLEITRRSIPFWMPCERIGRRSTSSARRGNEESSTESDSLESRIDTTSKHHIKKTFRTVTSEDEISKACPLLETSSADGRMPCLSRSSARMTRETG